MDTSTKEHESSMFPCLLMFSPLFSGFLVVVVFLFVCLFVFIFWWGVCWLVDFVCFCFVCLCRLSFGQSDWHILLPSSISQMRFWQSV